MKLAARRKLLLRAAACAALGVVGACSEGSQSTNDTDEQRDAASAVDAQADDEARPRAGSGGRAGGSSTTDRDNAGRGGNAGTEPEAGKGGGNLGPDNGARDASAEAGLDASVDATTEDAALDASVDATTEDAALDASVDANIEDAGLDASVDATTEDASMLDADSPVDGAADAEGDGTTPDSGIPDASSCEPWTATIDPGPDLRCVQEPPPDQGPFGGRVALTFDDGPNPATTPQVVAVLRQEQIPATFFMTGTRLQNPEGQLIAQDIHQDPLFRVANHTFTHPRLPNLSLDDALLEIEDTTTAIQESLLDPCYFPRFFRFPFGAASCDTVELVRERGFAVAGVHIDPIDWCFGAGGGHCDAETVPWLPEQYRSDMVGFLLERFDDYEGGIVLMHDVHQNTATLLPQVIEALRSAGATFVALDDAEVFPLLNAEILPPEPPACCDGVVH